MKFKKEEIIVIALAVILFLGFTFLVNPSATGYIIYTHSSYIYNSSAVNLSDNEIKLIPIITTSTTSIITQSNIQLSTATQDNDDKLLKVNSLNNDYVTIKKNESDKTLNITFASNLNNNDIISAYLIHNKITDVYICNKSTICSSPYSSLNYN